MNPARWALALACVTGFLLRVALPYFRVFQSGFVSFQETDAWFHFRTMEHLVRHFPFRQHVDAYGSVLDGQRVDTGPFFDWIPALLSLTFPSALPVIAAWYPAVLGVFIVLVVFLLTRELFDEKAAAFASLSVATFPGFFLIMTSLGFTDHHVMESLLSLVVLWLVTLRRPVVAGLALAAYLLTFVGGAFLVAVLVAWAMYGFLRYPDDAAFTPNLLPVFAIPLVLAAPFYWILWMEYSLLALAGGCLACGVAQYCRRLTRPRTVWLTVLLIPVVLALALFPSLLDILRYLSPSRTGAASAVAELQSLVYGKGYFSLEYAWREFGGAYILAVVGLLLLVESLLRRKDPSRTLFVFWALAVFALSTMQIRMLYYFAPVAAILAGYLMERAWSTGTRDRIAAVAVVAGLVFVPNLWRLAADPPLPSAAVPDSWRDALDWLRTETPEPFGDPNAYFATGIDPRSVRYGVLSWWDYGYWITAIGHRVPLTNPTQKNASVAATFFLAQTEDRALELMDTWRLRYVMMDARLADSLFPVYFPFLPQERRKDYLLEGMERQPDGSLRLRRFYTPAYYRTMAARLHWNWRGSEGGGAVSVVNPPMGGVFGRISKFANLEDATRAQADCATDGCMVVGDEPDKPMLPVPPITRLRRVYPERRGAATVAIFEKN